MKGTPVGLQHRNEAERGYTIGQPSRFWLTKVNAMQTGKMWNQSLCVGVELNYLSWGLKWLELWSMSCEAVGYLTIMQLTVNVHLVVARPCRSGWSLWLNQLAGFIRVFQEDSSWWSVFELSWAGFLCFPEIFSFQNGRAVQFISPLSTRRCVDIMVASGYYMSTDDEE